MRRSFTIAVAILETMTLALVAFAVEAFVDGDTITDLPSDHGTDQPSDRATAIQEVVADILDKNLDTLTGAEIDALLSYAADHPDLFGSDAAPPADPQGDGASDGSDDTTDSQGGDQPQD